MENQITYRLAGDSDIESINAFYNAIYQKQRTHAQFVWEYNSAPAGKAIYVIAELNGSIVGTQCAIPYYVVTAHNRQILTAKSEDTLVSPTQRGKNIFENMYAFLIEECKKNRIDFIWGFTYAEKPFRKIGFEIPFKSSMGLMVIKPLKATRYFYALTAKKTFTSWFKILLLSFMSVVKYKLLFLKKTKRITLDTGHVSLNTDALNYVKQDDLFGLKLDKDFLNYRILNNPYSSNYETLSYNESGLLKASVTYNMTREGIGYIIQLFFAPGLSPETKTAFMATAIKSSSLKTCIALRYWGFDHNVHNSEEIDLLKKCNFVFIKRGISFVGLKLNPSSDINFSNFVLSRMASQGTD